MTSLGKFFPKVLRDRLSARISAGSVIYIEVDFPDQEIKRNKYVVIGHIIKEYDTALCFFINKSKNAQIVAANPAVNRCQVEVTPKTEPFLPLPISYIGCHRARSFHFSELVTEVNKDPSMLKGVLCKATTELVIGAVKVAPGISTDHKGLIVTSLTPLAA